MEGTRINVKPMSVNQAWKGGRYKSAVYQDYEHNLMLRLPPRTEVIDSTDIHLYIEVGILATADLDNIAKCFIDVLQKKYKFNDRYITFIQMTKKNVSKNHEYITFRLELN
jgi:Holliday junction resolvase RusA-like endonuclease